MNVEAYRRTIRRRVWVMTALSLLYAAAMIAVHVLGKSPMGYAGDFSLGLSVGLVLCCLVRMPRYTQALRDEQALRRLWNQEHDERMKAIKAKAGAPMLLYTSGAMVAIALLISGWNMTVAETLLFVASTQLVICAAVKLACMRTM